MERLHILDECVLPLTTLKNKVKPLFIWMHWVGGSNMDLVYDIFESRNISLNLFPRIAYDISSIIFVLNKQYTSCCWHWYKALVHLESRNVDQENKRTEIGCTGRFACVKPFCFTSFLSNYLIVGQTDSFLLNLNALLVEAFWCCRKNNWVLKDN